MINYTKLWKMLNCFEKQITHNLKDAGVTVRATNTNGIWCHLLLPTILLIYNIKYDVSQVYSLTAYLSISLVFYSTLFLLFTSTSSLVIRDEQYSGVTACGLVSALFIYIYVDYDFVPAALITTPTTCLYSSLLRMTLHKHPNTFSLGEAMVTIQAVVLIIFMLFSKLIVESSMEYDFVNTTVIAFLFSVGLMVMVMSKLREENRTLKNLLFIILGGASLCLSILMKIFGIGYLNMFLRYIIDNDVRVKIFGVWLCLLVSAISILYANTVMGRKADSATRKTFHVLASFVFMTGILLDQQLMKLAAGLGFGVLIFIEALRVSEIEPFSSLLQSAFLAYCDEKDLGSFAMTPVYLFAGLSCPLLLVPTHPDNTFELLSGVLAIGIGDTAASWFGSRYGSTRWTDSNRTIVGTACNIVSQIFSVYVLHVCGLLHSPYLCLKTVFSACVSGLVEAKTDQIDNLILPLCNIIAFQLISFI